MSNHIPRRGPWNGSRKRSTLSDVGEVEAEPDQGGDAYQASRRQRLGDPIETAEDGRRRGGRAALATASSPGENTEMIALPLASTPITIRCRHRCCRHNSNGCTRNEGRERPRAAGSHGNPGPDIVISLATMSLDYQQHIVQDPAICGGQPVLRGTRVTLRTVLASHAEDAAVEDILADFPSLREEDVRAAIAFAALSAAEDLPTRAIPSIR